MKTSKIVGGLGRIHPTMDGTWYICKEDAPATETAGCQIKTWKDGLVWKRWAAVYWLDYSTPSPLFTTSGNSLAVPYYSTWTIGASTGIESICATWVGKDDPALGVTWDNLELTSTLLGNTNNQLWRSAQNQTQAVGPSTHIVQMITEEVQSGICFFPVQADYDWNDGSYVRTVYGTGPYYCNEITLVDGGYCVSEGGKI